MKLKKLTACLLAGLMMFGGYAPTEKETLNLEQKLTAKSAYSGTCGDNLTWESADGVLKISGIGSMSDYTQGYSGEYPPWYNFKEAITTVVIEDGITNIGASAFSGCSKLTSIIIPINVTSIEDYVFYGCSSLDSIIIPNTITTIGWSAFHGCTSLTSITIPDSVTNIGNAAFYDCSSLISFVIPESITKIETQTFAECKKLQFIIIPENVMDLGYGVFQHCSSDLIIYGMKGSVAEAYAIQQKITFKPVSEAPAFEETQPTTEIPAPTDPSTTPVQPSGFVMGDMDGNGIVDASDASYILQYAASKGAGFVGDMQAFMEYLKNQ